MAGIAAWTRKPQQPQPKGENEMAKKEYLSASQVAAIMGDKWTRQRVHVEYKRGTFPEPETIVEMNGYSSPLWTPEQIKSFQRKRGASNEK